MVLNELTLLLRSRAVVCTSEPGRGQGYAGLPLGLQSAYQPSGVPTESSHKPPVLARQSWPRSTQSLPPLTTPEALSLVGFPRNRA